jgi:hypothetical protein
LEESLGPRRPEDHRSVDLLTPQQRFLFDSFATLQYSLSSPVVYVTGRDVAKRFVIAIPIFADVAHLFEGIQAERRPQPPAVEFPLANPTRSPPTDSEQMLLLKTNRKMETMFANTDAFSGNQNAVATWMESSITQYDRKSKFAEDRSEAVTQP